MIWKYRVYLLYIMFMYIYVCTHTLIFCLLSYHLQMTRCIFIKFVEFEMVWLKSWLCSPGIQSWGLWEGTPSKASWNRGTVRGLCRCWFGIGSIKSWAISCIQRSFLSVIFLLSVLHMKMYQALVGLKGCVVLLTMQGGNWWESSMLKSSHQAQGSWKDSSWKVLFCSI